MALLAVLVALGCRSPTAPSASLVEFDAQDVPNEAAAVQQATFEAPAAPLFPPPVEGRDPAAEGPPPSGAGPLRATDLADLHRLPPGQREPIDIDAVLRLATSSSRVIRDAGQFLSPSNPLLNNPDLVASEWDDEIFAASPLGAEAALAAFDTQAAAGALRRQDSLGQTGGFFPGGVSTINALASNSGSVYGRVAKANSRGGLASLVHNWDYAPNTLASNGFNAPYAGFLGAEYRQPLLAGRGADFTSIAGPSTVTGGQLGRGVRVARLEEDAARATLDAQRLTLVRQSQDAYWDYWTAYESHGRLAASRDAARGLLDRVRARAAAGLPGGDAANEAQAEDAFLQRQATVNNALAELLHREDRLRRMIGLAAGGDRLLIPIEAPYDGPLALDWEGSVGLADASRPELRRQRLRVEVLDLQARAAEDLVRPRLDLVLGAQLNGFGNNVFGDGFNSLLGGGNTGWSVGTEFSSPVGRRARLAQRRQLEQQLAKARHVLAAQRDEVRHELAYCFREIDRAYEAVLLARRRREAARRRQRAADAEFEAGRTSVDLVLRAQASLADAEQAHLRSLAAYSQAIVELQYREGLQHRERPPAAAPR